MAKPRVSRGRRIQALATIYFQQNGWVKAENTPASMPGKDTTGMPGWSVETKGTRDNPLPAALRQAAKNAGEGETPLVVWCPDGYGEARIDEWVVAFTFRDAVELMKMAEGFEAAADEQLAEALEDRFPASEGWQSQPLTPELMKWNNRLGALEEAVYGPVGRA